MQSKVSQFLCTPQQRNVSRVHAHETAMHNIRRRLTVVFRSADALEIAAQHAAQSPQTQSQAQETELPDSLEELYPMRDFIQKQIQDIDKANQPKTRHTISFGKKGKEHFAKQMRDNLQASLQSVEQKIVARGGSLTRRTVSNNQNGSGGGSGIKRPQPPSSPPPSKDVFATFKRKVQYSKPLPPPPPSATAPSSSPSSTTEWEECWTDDGQQYWYNHKSKESTWVNPFLQKTKNKQSTNKSSILSSNNSINNSNNKLISSKDTTTTNNNLRKSNSTGTTVSNAVNNSNNNNNNNVTNSSNNNSNNNNANSLDLSVWEECSTDDGFLFWYNTVTQESTWENPMTKYQLVYEQDFEKGKVHTLRLKKKK